MKITSTFSFKSQIIDSTAQPSATVVLPSVDPVKNDTFESQEKTDKSKRKKQLGIAGTLLVSITALIIYYRHKTAKKVELAAKKDFEKRQKELEEARKKLEKELEEKKKAQLQKDIDRLCWIYDIKTRCTSYEEFDKAIKAKNAEKERRFHERMAKSREEAEKRWQRYEEEAKKAQEDYQKVREDLNNAWENYKKTAQETKESTEQFKKWWQEFQAKWQEQEKNWEDIFEKYRPHNENARPKSNNTGAKAKTEYTAHSNTYSSTKDIEDYTGFTPDEINIIKKMNNTNPLLIYDVENNKSVLARYLDITEDEVKELFNKNKSVYRKVALKWHPDRTHDETKEGRFKLANFFFNR